MDALGYWFVGMVLYWLWSVFTTKETCFSTILAMIWPIAILVHLWKNFQDRINPDDDTY